MAHTIHRIYLFAQSLGAVIVNAAIAAGTGWLLFNDLPSVPLTGSPGILSDLWATSVILPFLLTLVLNRLVLLDFSRQKIPTTTFRYKNTSVLRFLPQRVLLRALLLTALTAAFICPAAIAAADWLIDSPVGLQQFLILKSLYSAGISGLIAPLVIVCAMSDGSAAQSDARRKSTRPSMQNVQQ